MGTSRASPSALTGRSSHSANLQREAPKSGTWPSARWSPAWRVVTRTRTLPSPSAPTAACSRSVASAESCASGTSRPGSSSTSSTRVARERLTWSSARMAGPSSSPASSLSRLSGTLPPEPRSARSSPPGTAGRRSIFPPTDAACWRPTATAKGLSGTSTPSRGRGVPARSRTAPLTPEEWEEFLPGRPYEPACAT